MSNTRRRGSRLAAAALGVTSLLAFTFLAACGTGRPKVAIHLPDVQGRVDNGMRLIVLPDATTDLVEVDVRFEVGANEDPPGKAGLAHLVEHLMFQQRPDGPGTPPLWEVIRQQTIFVNAYTNWDSTHYMALARKEALEDLLAVEAVRLHLGCKTIDVAEFEREREVVRNEMRTHMGTPEAMVQVKLLEAIYPEGHPYRREVGGDDLQLARITLEDVCQFMARYYTPERATLIIAGNVPPEKEVAALVTKWLGRVERRAPAPRVPVPPLALERRRVDLEMDVDEPSVFVAWALPPSFTADAEATRFLIGSVTGRAAAFGDDYEFSTGVDVHLLGGELAPAFVLEMRLRDVGKVDEALDAIWRSARRAHRPFEEGSHFDDVRAQVKASLVYAFEALTARTVRFGDYAQFDGGKRYFAGELDRISKIDGDRVRRFVKRTLDPKRAVVVVVKPREGGGGKYARARLAAGGGSTGDEREHFPVDPAEARRPVAVPAAESPLARARRVELGNGMDLIMLPTESSLPVVTVRLVFGAGSAHEPAERAGLAGAAADYLLAPVGYDEAEGFSADVLGQIGAEAFALAGADSTVFQARGLEIYLEVLIRGLERLIKGGYYDQEQLEKFQKFTRFRLKRRVVASEVAFAKVLRAAVFGPEHPYARTGEPRLETIGRLNHDDVVDFKDAHYRAGNATLIVAGRFDPERAERIARAHFGRWKRTSPDEPIRQPAAARAEPLYVGVVGQDQPTVQVAIGFPSIVGVDGGYAARLVLSEILDERVSVVRERLGASYGVYAGHVVRRGPGWYRIGGRVDAERAGDAIAALRAELQSLREGGRFEEDFVRARRTVLRQLLARQTDSETLADQLAFLAIHGLPPDFYDRLVKHVAAMPPALVKAVIGAELAPEREAIVCMGSRAAVEKAFAGAGIPLEKVTWQEVAEK